MNNRNKHYPVNAACLFFSCCLAFVYALFLTGAGVAHAKTMDEAKAAYAQGRFTEAARIGESLGTSQGFALSAESLSIHANYIAKKGEKKELLEQAVALARKAVTSDPGNADAHLQLARAIGRRAETVGVFEAAGEAEKIRESTENALRINPKLAAAHLSLGRWHSELVGAMGSFIARTVYGARKKDAIASFEKALALAPDAKYVPLQYAFGLLALDSFKYREKARDFLMRSIKLPAKDAYERILHTEAVKALDSLDEYDDDDDDDDY